MPDFSSVVVGDTGPRASWESYIEGPRWAFGAAWVRAGAINCGVHVDYVTEEKAGFLRKLVTWKVSGPQSQVELFRDETVRVVREYQGR